jgi:hypothetical protein
VDNLSVLYGLGLYLFGNGFVGGLDILVLADAVLVQDTAKYPEPSDEAGEGHDVGDDGLGGHEAHLGQKLHCNS